MSRSKLILLAYTSPSVFFCDLYCNCFDSAIGHSCFDVSAQLDRVNQSAFVFWLLCAFVLWSRVIFVSVSVEFARILVWVVILLIFYHRCLIHTKYVVLSSTINYIHCFYTIKNSEFTMSFFIRSS